jgi:hypothetical protein
MIGLRVRQKTSLKQKLWKNKDALVLFAIIAIAITIFVLSGVR